MPTFIFLFRGSPQNQSPQQMQDGMARWEAWMGELSKKTQLTPGKALTIEGKLVTGRKNSVTDGPFGETKDVVSGFLTLTAPDFDTAAAYSRGCPVLDYDGTVEIRQIRERS